MKYGILLYPHPNKRYFEAMKPLCVNELKIMTQCLHEQVSNINYEEIEGLELLTFESGELSHEDKGVINSMSSKQAVFEIKTDGCLKPVRFSDKYYFKEDMSNILKYKGKTNEVFTDMMINIGVFSSAYAENFNEPLNILDPMCSKGTTLYQSLIKGYNAYGIDIDKKDVEEATSFIKRYFEFHHYKYNVKKDTIICHGKKGGTKFSYETADSAENYKKEDRRKILIANGNTIAISDIYPKKETFHSIITDLPYGVQHASENSSQIIRIEDLLRDALKGWYKVLKTGGTIVLAYNTFTLKRTDISEILCQHGFRVLNEEPYNNFEHWVEQAVNRDIIVAIK